MPCHHPMPAWRTKDGTIELTHRGRNPDDTMQLPCGHCVGCRKAAAKSWTLRCHLELQQHAAAAAITLTYDEKHCPATLSTRDLSLYIKRLRKSMPNTAIRFFGCGEYGDAKQRPHYHAILYGPHHERDRKKIEKAWSKGRAQTNPVTTKAIAYIAGYVAKKYTRPRDRDYTEQVDPDTGEVYIYQPPFLQMSRRPGIASAARKHTQSWRLYAITPNTNGQRQAVPKYLHDAWRKTATPEQVQNLLQEKENISKQRENTKRSRQAQEKIDMKQIEMQTQMRTL